MLERYHEKRDFSRSPEPRGERGPEEGAGEPLRRFVVQKHAARRTHFDLRLEVGGTLKSWAVPKGPSADPETRRLAVHVEDHPLEYADFEGTIPKGEYGAGNVIIWDRGRYRPVGVEDDSDEAIEAAVHAGKLEFELLGERLRGRWTLVRMREREGEENNWLLIKKRDEYAEADDPDGLVERYRDSVVSGRGVDESLEDGAARRAGEAPRPPVDVRPMLARAGDEAPQGEAWCYELKLDGIRTIAWAAPGGAVQIYSRRGQRLESAFPEIADAVELLARRSGSEFVVDGEIVAARPDGAASFEDLQPRFNLREPREIAYWARARPAEVHLFDLLWLDGEDLRERPLSDRKERLRRLTRSGGHGLLYTPHEVGASSELMSRARREGWEGIIAKRLNSRYRSGERSRDWVKVKNIERQEFVVGGWTDPGGARHGFGALVVGYYEHPDGGPLRCAGRVGSGFSDEDLHRISERLRALERDTTPFNEVPDDLGDAHWVRPELVAEVAYREWTQEGRLRQPVFLGLRQDVDPGMVVREGARQPKRQGPPVELTDQMRTIHEALDVLEREEGEGELLVEGKTLRVTNLSKVLWPDCGVTKGELMRYYVSVAPALLPTVADRPLVLERYPDGIEAEMFYQQRAPEPVPDPVRTAKLESEGEEVERIIAGDLYTLLYTTQLAAISQHVWPSRLPSLESADYTVLDLDPHPGLPFSTVCEVALAVRAELERLGIRGYAKTSGASGIHVVIPLALGTSYETARLLAELLARLTNRSQPDTTTVQRVVAKRGPRVYLDWLQNRRGKTVASAYSVRPVAGARVSTPLRWSELEQGVEAEDFNVRTLADRLSETGDLWAACRSDSNDVREVLELF